MMADANPSSRWPGDALGGSKIGSKSRSVSEASELESLREETRRLRQLVVQLSRIAIRNAVNMK
jgi:hypothetical protein